jgi:O-methyltransferase involved in polyketide biosynthesis
MTKIDGATLDGVAATGLWTLRNRAEESLHPGSTFHDPLSERLYRGIDYDYEQFGTPNQTHPLRAQALDIAVREYLDRHPAATVVALGEGLQTTYWRLGRPDNDWLSVDLPPVIDLRARLLPQEPRMTGIPVSALDPAWMDVPDPARGVFISAEGLFMYFERDQVMSLIAECAARFPGGRLFFDSIPPLVRNRVMNGYRMSDRYTAPPMPFGLSVSEAARLPAQIPGVATAEDLQPPPGRKAWKSRALRKIANAPGLRDLRPSITLLNFAAPGGLS